MCGKRKQNKGYILEIGEKSLKLDGKPFYLASGEMHYFRFFKDGWRRRLKLMKDFGLTAVQTYVPWNLHEKHEGEFDFSGNLDLAAFLELCDEIGLKVIVFSHSPINARGHFPDCLKAQIDIANSGWLWNVMQKSDNVIASIAGHLHYDNIVYDKRIVAIDTQCATGLHKGKWDISCPDREFGTITETAFDVVSVTNELIYCTRFGAGNDRVARIIRDISEQ